MLPPSTVLSSLSMPRVIVPLLVTVLVTEPVMTMPRPSMPLDSTRPLLSTLWLLSMKTAVPLSTTTPPLDSIRMLPGPPLALEVLTGSVTVFVMVRSAASERSGTPMVLATTRPPAMAQLARIRRRGRTWYIQKPLGWFRQRERNLNCS